LPRSTRPAPAAAAETRSAEHVLAELEALRTELYVLQIAGGFDSARQIAVTAEQLAALPEPVAKEVAGLAALPFAIIPVGAPEGREKRLALRTLAEITNAAGRDVMWCSATGDADRWPPPGSLVIADLAQQTRDEHLKLILLDSGSTRWPPGPSARLLTLLESDLPWTISLTDRAGHSAQPAPAATRP
jgi:hypothetical protein